MNVECISTMKGRLRGRVLSEYRKNWSNLTFGFPHLFRWRETFFFFFLPSRGFRVCRESLNPFSASRRGNSFIFHSNIRFRNFARAQSRYVIHYGKFPES